MSNERIEAIRKEVEEYEEVMKMELGCHYINPSMPRLRDLLDHIDKLEAERMPAELTAENGAKFMLSGEFFEEQEVIGEYYEDIDQVIRVPVSWDTIKSLYKMIYANREALNK